MSTEKNQARRTSRILDKEKKKGREKNPRLYQDQRGKKRKWPANREREICNGQRGGKEKHAGPPQLGGQKGPATGGTRCAKKSSVDSPAEKKGEGATNRDYSGKKDSGIQPFLKKRANNNWRKREAGRKAAEGERRGPL